MYNLHCHSLLSDGELLPSEVAVHYAAKGYSIIAITDHTDYSNIDSNIKSITEFCRRWPASQPVKVLPGIELTHLPAEQFAPLAKYARKNGIKIIVAHGQTPVEPVISGTNQAALEADIDILAHPGNISVKEVKLASKRGIFLEISGRKGHNRGNRQVVKQALLYGANLILNTDSHAPEDIISPAQLANIGIKAGLSRKQIDSMYIKEGLWLKKHF
ncbi:MAG: histidinol phosphate phosphatase domain-containing protein [Candidatus Omnitrophica bacterium]|nr:histidinol phosphate phosphatase domain-containing protein [Candidatus Omnitrophota bacterium]